MTQSILITGASGRMGRNAAEAFAQAGWDVRKFNRKTDTLVDAAKGVDVILHGMNPVYTDWAKHLPKLTAQVIEAAKASGATVIIPGNVYVFGEDAPARFATDTPHGATNMMGRLRIEMEAAFREAGIPTINLRAGDYIDTQASGNWFDIQIMKNVRKGIVTFPGDLDAPRAWGYLPDIARAMVELAEIREALPRYADISFPGFTLSGREMTAAAEKALGRDLKLKQMNWLPLRLLSPFWPMMRRLIEMSYLWNKPHHLDGELFESILPEFKMTSVDEAMKAALAPLVNPASQHQPKPADAMMQPAQ